MEMAVVWRITGAGGMPMSSTGKNEKKCGKQGPMLCDAYAGLCGASDVGSDENHRSSLSLRLGKAPSF